MSLDYTNPKKYMGDYNSCYIGHATDVSIRSDAASGGVVTAILIYMLEKGLIQGALVSKQMMNNGALDTCTFIATSREEIMDCRTSIYMDFPLASHYKDILTFDGKVAVVALPCQLKALEKFETVHPELKGKVFLKIALFCSGNPSKEMTEKILSKSKIDQKDIERIYFRKGHWRGETHIQMKNGDTKRISYLYNHCTYKNLYFYSMPRCYSCQDHFALYGDISCGDVWLKEMKDDPIKHTGFVVKNDKALKVIEMMQKDGALAAKEVSAEKVLKSQKRALAYKFCTGKAKAKIGKLFGIKYNGKVIEPTSWNHYLAIFFISINIAVSRNKVLSKLAFMLPRRLMFLYMGFIRTLLNF